MQKGQLCKLKGALYIQVVKNGEGATAPYTSGLCIHVSAQKFAFSFVIFHAL